MGEIMNVRAWLAILLLFGITAFIAQPTASAQRDAFSGATITGTVYFVGGPRPGRSLPFRLTIDRLTTPEEIGQLNAALQSGNQDGLMHTLDDVSIRLRGNIRRPRRRSRHVDSSSARASA